VVAEDVADVALLAADDVEVMLTAVRGLNEAIADGARELADRGWPGPVAVLPADLPFLTAADLARALSAARGQAAVVADAAGIGTTLLVAASPAELRPRFGPDSYRLHQQTGAAALPIGHRSTLQMDVDVLDDLHLPGDLQLLGSFTRSVVADLATSGFPQVRVLP
jgi:2-phospho-L-lactate/phosphoenolpyruvate guanylyltransferase